MPDGRQTQSHNDGCRNAKWVFGDVTVVVDTEQRERATHIFRECCRVAGLEPSPKQHWEPYPKLGPHSLIAASIRFAGRSQNEVIVEIEAVCAALAVLPEPYDPLTDCGRIHIPYRNGEMSYDRVLDNRITPFKVEDAIWFRIFVQTDAAYQLARRRDFA